MGFFSSTFICTILCSFWNILTFTRGKELFDEFSYISRSCKIQVRWSLRSVWIVQFCGDLYRLCIIGQRRPISICKMHLDFVINSAVINMLLILSMLKFGTCEQNVFRPCRITNHSHRKLIADCQTVNSNIIIPEFLSNCFTIPSANIF